jgi:hypothetical protein
MPEWLLPARLPVLKQELCQNAQGIDLSKKNGPLAGHNPAGVKQAVDESRRPVTYA